MHDDLGIPLRYTSTENFLPLHYAVVSGSTDIVSYILKEEPEEATLCPEGTEKYTLLNCAVFCPQIQVEITRELIKLGAEVQLPLTDENRLLIKLLLSTNDNEIITIFKEKYPEIVEELLEEIEIEPLQKAIINNKINDLDNLYKGSYSIQQIISIITLIVKNNFLNMKPFLLRILDDLKNETIEPPNSENDLKDGVCHWICLYCDLDVAKVFF